MIDTIRIIMFLECNMNCSYCCNKNEKFNSQFNKKSLSDIDFSLYKNICITGGEPFLHNEKLFSLLKKIPHEKNIYIYTNGTLINDSDIATLIKQKNLKCLNIGIHTLEQLDSINEDIEKKLPVRFMAQDINCEKLLKKYPERLNRNNLKSWSLDDCDMPNEEWVLLNSKELS
jgi:organic radical activating enzyme